MPQGPFNTLVAKMQGLTSYAALALGKQSDLLMSAFHGTKYNQGYNGNLFWAANSAGVTMSSGLATTYLGICLSNPAASTKNLAVRKISGLFDVAPAGVAALGLITGFAAGGVTVHTTALTLHAAKLGASVSGAQGLVDSACTIVGTPAWTEQFAVNIASTDPVGFNVDLEGGIIIPPGGYAAVGSVGAAGPTSGFFGSIQWEEINP